MEEENQPKSQPNNQKANISKRKFLCQHHSSIFFSFLKMSFISFIRVISFDFSFFNGRIIKPKPNVKTESDIEIIHHNVMQSNRDLNSIEKMQ